MVNTPLFSSYLQAVCSNQQCSFSNVIDRISHRRYYCRQQLYNGIERRASPIAFPISSNCWRSDVERLVDFIAGNRTTSMKIIPQSVSRANLGKLMRDRQPGTCRFRYISSCLKKILWKQQRSIWQTIVRWSPNIGLCQRTLGSPKRRIGADIHEIVQWLRIFVTFSTL